MVTTNANKKGREEIHRAIWSIADELRGAVDGWDFKNYVLGTMFYRYISENLTAYINEGEAAAGNKGFDYSFISDEEAETAREGLVEEKGFFILPSELFCNVRARAASDDNLNETLERVFNNIESSAEGTESEDDLAGLFDDFDVNSNKLGSTVKKRNERLTKLLDGIAAMDLGSVKDHDMDAFGDAYEYLMTMYASNAGKSGGEFFTPSDVSVLLTKLGTVGRNTVNKVYDPACGSGSLLLKAEQILGKDSVTKGFFGQEVNITTYNLCRINMFLHDIGFDKFDIACEDTLINPQHWDEEPFDLIVSNPPYSLKWISDENPLLINDPRFSPAGVLAPKKAADYAFIMHCLSWLSSNGTAAIVCFPGIMYRGAREKKIRQYLIDNNYVDCIVQLPSNLFYGATIATCIMILKKGKNDNNVLFIDASEEYIKITNNNKLTEENISNIVNAYSSRKELEYFAHLATYDEIKAHDYVLSVSTYVEQKDTREKIDIEKLNIEIREIITREDSLRKEIEKIVKIIGEDNKDERINKLFTFNDSNPVYPHAVEHKKLSEIATISRGGSLQKKDFVDTGAPCINYGQIYTKYNLFTDKTYSFISEEKASRQRKASFGDIIMAVTSENIEDVCKCVVWLGDQDVAVSGHTAIIKHNQNAKYLAYYFNSNMFFSQKRKIAHGTKVMEVTPDTLNEIIIPVPPLDIQNKIVDILDRFMTLTTELSSSLTAELEARKRQYEYYKERLLSFN